MTTDVIQTREEAHRWLVLHIRYSRYDTNFIDNVSRLIGESKPLTKNQNELWEKLVNKYRKQIKTNKQDPDDLLALNWKLEPVDFDVNYAPLLWIEDNEVNVRFPYNQRVVKEIRNMLERHDNNWMHNYESRFKWNKEKRCWHGEAFPALVNDLVEFSNRNEFEVDSSVQAIVESIPGTYMDWVPTARYVEGDCYVVSNLTPELLKALPKPNITPSAIRDLVGLGIAMGDSMVDFLSETYSDEMVYMLCFREVSINDPTQLEEYLAITNNDVIIQNADHSKMSAYMYGEDSEAQLKLTSAVSDMLLWPREEMGDYVVYSEEADTYSFDKTVDLVITTSSNAYSLNAIANIAKKVILITE
jgi:hypothetical protein